MAVAEEILVKPFKDSFAIPVYVARVLDLPFPFVGSFLIFAQLGVNVAHLRVGLL